MLGDIATTILYLALIAIAIFVIGFCTPKYFLYGGITTGIFWLTAPLAPSVTRTDAEAIIPHLLDLWTVFPRAIHHTIGNMSAEYGTLGIIVTLTIGLILAIPYLSGCYLGIRCYPELHLLRIFI